MSTGEDQTFVEDVGRKAREFHLTRGQLNRKQLSGRWHRALEQIAVMRDARIESLDPGKAPAGVASLSGARKSAKVVAVDNPYLAASANFASDCVAVTGVDVRDAAVLTLRAKRGATGRLEMRTVGVFRFNERTRQWNLVGRSGPGKSESYAWAQAHRDGIYAAIALPKDARRLAVERVAYHYASIGVHTGDFARASDLLDRDRFRQLVIDHDDLDLSNAADKRRLKALEGIQREVKALGSDWPGSVPNGGAPEWQLIEQHATLDPDVLEIVRIGDLIDVFIDALRLRNVVGRWYPMGPYNVNGRIKSLAIHPTNRDILYAGAGNGGVWKTTNRGDTWRALWKFEDTMGVGSLAIAKSSPNTIYVATGEDTPGWGINYGGVGIYKSTDGGSTWAIKGPASVVGTDLSKIVVHPTNADTAYVGGASGLFKTTNGGTAWSLVLAGHVTDVVMAEDRPNILYAGVQNSGIHKSTNGGTSWNRIQVTTHWELPPFLEFDVTVPTGNAAGWVKLAIGKGGSAGSDFVFAKLGPNSATTIATRDGGVSWFPGFGSEGVDYDEWCSFVSINPSNPDRVHIGSVGMKTTANMTSWHATTGTHADHHQMVYDPANAAHSYVCCDGGVYKSTNWGETWSLKSDRLQATQLMSLGVAQHGTFVVGGATQDQGIIQTEGTFDWDDFGGGNEWGMFVVDPNDSENIFVSPGGGQLRRSTDRGRTWSNPTTGLTDYWSAQGRQTIAASFRHVAVQPGNSRIVIGVAQVADDVKDASGAVTASYPAKPRIYHSTNGGQSWTVSLNLPSTGSRVAYAHNGVRAYAATQDGRFYRSDSCGLGGWTEAATGTNKPPTGYISAIAVDPDEVDVVYIAYTNKTPAVYRSTDGGAHWTAINGATAATRLPTIPVSSIVVDPENDDVLYVGTDIGVFRSNDGGASWYFYNDSIGDYDLPKVAVTELAHQRAQNKLFAATLGRGLYYTYTSGIPRLRVVAISHHLDFKLRPGIERLRVTDGHRTWEMTRAEVIRRIEAGTNVYTRSPDGYRAEVQVMPPDEVHPRWYLRTAADATEADNLLSLPEF